MIAPESLVGHEYAPVVLRALRNPDLCACHRLDRMNCLSPERWEEPEWLDRAQEWPGVVAVQGARVVGAVVYENAVRALVIRKLLVDPRLHREGIGTLLVGRVVEACMTHPLCAVECDVELSTTRNHLAALAFFKQLKWKGFLVPRGGRDFVRFVKENRRK